MTSHQVIGLEDELSNALIALGRDGPTTFWNRDSIRQAVIDEQDKKKLWCDRALGMALSLGNIALRTSEDTAEKVASIILDYHKPQRRALPYGFLTGIKLIPTREEATAFIKKANTAFSSDEIWQFIHHIKASYLPRAVTSLTTIANIDHQLALAAAHKLPRSTELGLRILDELDREIAYNPKGLYNRFGITIK